MLVELAGQSKRWPQNSQRASRRLRARERSLNQVIENPGGEQPIAALGRVAGTHAAGKRIAHDVERPHLHAASPRRSRSSHRPILEPGGGSKSLGPLGGARLPVARDVALAVAPMF